MTHPTDARRELYRRPTGEFGNQPGVNAASSVSLAPDTPHLNIDEPRFQAMTGPLPHLDGARVEYSDGRSGTIRVKTPHGYRAAAAYVEEESGERVESYIPPSTTYRLTSWDGSQERLDDELTLIRLRQDENDFYDAMDEARDRVAGCFSDEDELFSRTPYCTDRSGVPELRVSYSNIRSPQNSGAFYYNPQTKAVRAGAGANTRSRRAARIRKLMSTPEFMSAADDLVRESANLLDAQGALIAHQLHLEHVYGMRFS